MTAYADASPQMRLLRWETVAPHRAYHAALVASGRARNSGYQVPPHRHDFYELMCVLAGDAVHTVNGDAAPIGAGDLVFLRPGDWHSVRFRQGMLLQYINIAFPAEIWERFAVLTQIPQETIAWPVSVSLPAPVADCAATFRRALARFRTPDGHVVGSGLEVCRLLAFVSGLLLDASDSAESRGDLPDAAPLWLKRACRTLRDGENLRMGLPAFVQSAGVSRTHLARALKAHTGQTPTEYINGLRLDRAAQLLTTTTLPLLDIAGECGFEQAPYFYRLFRARFKTTPQAFRNHAAARIVPA